MNAPMVIPNLAARAKARAEVETFAAALPKAISGIGAVLRLLRRDGNPDFVENGAFTSLFFDTRGVPLAVLSLFERAAAAIDKEAGGPQPLPPIPDEPLDHGKTADWMERAANKILLVENGVAERSAAALALAGTRSWGPRPSRAARAAIEKAWRNHAIPVCEMLDFCQLLKARRQANAGQRN